MATKVQQTSHHPFKSLSDSDLSSAAAGVGNLSTSSNGNVERKRVTINDDASTNDSSSTDKSKTLPSKAKQTLTLKRTNSLKRSITLPRWGKTIVCQLVYLKTGFEDSSFETLLYLWNVVWNWNCFPQKSFCRNGQKIEAFDHERRGSFRGGQNTSVDSNKYHFDDGNIEKSGLIKIYLHFCYDQVML